VGGHSIDDDTLKFGLSVTGFVDPRRMWTNAGAKQGDLLILTKPLGTGTLMAGLKNGDYTEADITEALDSMTRLNDLTSVLSRDELGAIHAATDITGFGLTGHLQQLSRASQVGFRLRFRDLPVFEKTFSSLHAENLTKAHRSNESYTRAAVQFKFEPDPVDRKILFDPQTSGGLLLSVAPGKATALLERIRTRFPSASLIGEAIPLSPGTPAGIEIHD
jgi:selenide,water dikinase